MLNIDGTTGTVDTDTIPWVMVITDGTMVILDTATTDITTTTLTTVTSTTTLITVTTLSMDITVTRKFFRMENSRTQMQSLPKNFSHQKKYNLI